MLCPVSQAAHYLTPVQFGNVAAVAEGGIEQLHLCLAEPGFEFGSRAGWRESPDSSVLAVGGDGEQALGFQILDRTVGGLLGDPEDGKQFAGRDPGVPTDEVEDAVVGSAQSSLGQDPVRQRGELAVAEVQGLDGVTERGLAIWVNHLD